MFAGSLQTCLLGSRPKTGSLRQTVSTRLAASPPLPRQFLMCLSAFAEQIGHMNEFDSSIKGMTAPRRGRSFVLRQAPNPETIPHGGPASGGALAAPSLPL